MQIDYIISYIDYNQPEIKQLFKDVTGEDVTGKHNWTCIELKCTIELVLKNIPFINTLYIVCKDIQKLPDDVNKMIESSNGKIKRINESEILPKDFISFSSACIEMFIWRIPGLSEHFIYSNDDMIPFRVMDECNFFNESGTPIMEFHTIADQLRSLYDIHTLNNNMCVNGGFRNIGNFRSVTRSVHTLRPLTRTICERCFQQHEDLIYKSLYKRRSYNNFNMDLFCLYGLKNGMIQNKHTKYCFKFICMSSGQLGALDELIHNNPYDIICFNDDIETRDVYNRIVQKLDIIIKKALDLPPQKQKSADPTQTAIKRTSRKTTYVIQPIDIFRAHSNI